MVCFMGCEESSDAVPFVRCSIILVHYRHRLDPQNGAK